MGIGICLPHQETVLEYHIYDAHFIYCCFWHEGLSWLDADVTATQLAEFVVYICFRWRLSLRLHTTRPWWITFSNLFGWMSACRNVQQSFWYRFCSLFCLSHFKGFNQCWISDFEYIFTIHHNLFDFLGSSVVDRAAWYSPRFIGSANKKSFYCLIQWSLQCFWLDDVASYRDYRSDIYGRTAFGAWKLSHFDRISSFW